MRLSRRDRGVLSDTVQIVPMRARHLVPVVGIDALVYPQPWSRSLYEGELAQPPAKRVYVVARVGRQVVGHAGLVFVLDQGHITTVAVHPDWQGRSVGTALVLATVREAVARQATSITLEVRAGNTAAQRLYAHFGFQTEGTRKDYYGATNNAPAEDALIMWARAVDSIDYRARLARIADEIGPGFVDHLAQARSNQPRSVR